MPVVIGQLFVDNDCAGQEEEVGGERCLVNTWEGCERALVEAKSGSGCQVGSAHGGSRGAEALKTSGCGGRADEVNNNVVETCCGGAGDAFKKSVCCCSDEGAADISVAGGSLANSSCVTSA